MVLVMALAVWISFAALGLHVDFTSNWPLVSVALFYAAATFFYLHVRRDRQIADMLAVVAQLFLALLLGLLLTYAASATALPYRDAQLSAIDLWLGFHRAAYVGAINSVPGLGAILEVAYLSIQPQTALIPLALLLVRQLPRLQSFVLAMGRSRDRPTEPGGSIGADCRLNHSLQTTPLASRPRSASARNRVFPRLGLVWDVAADAMLKSIKVLLHA
jgi:PAP2 superfamily